MEANGVNVFKNFDFWTYYEATKSNIRPIGNSEKI